MHEKKHKDINILTETYSNHDQIHHQIHIRSNWLGPIFFSPVDSHTKGSLVLLHPAPEGITEVDTDPKGRFVSFKVISLPLMTECYVLMPFQRVAPGNSWLGGISLKEYKIIWKIKMKEMKKKKILGDFICSMDTMDRYGGNKTLRLYRCCFCYALNVDNGLRIYGEGRTQISLSSPAMICPLARTQDTQGLY